MKLKVKQSQGERIAGTFFLVHICLMCLGLLKKCRDSERGNKVIKINGIIITGLDLHMTL